MLPSQKCAKSSLPPTSIRPAFVPADLCPLLSIREIGLGQQELASGQDWLQVLEFGGRIENLSQCDLEWPKAPQYRRGFSFQAEGEIETLSCDHKA
jgi:hypothetical protein